MVTTTEQELVVKGVSRTFPGVHGGKPLLLCNLLISSFRKMIL
jgi:hypothetical protein